MYEGSFKTFGQTLENNKPYDVRFEVDFTQGNI